jgi:hypothetical protein
VCTQISIHYGERSLAHLVWFNGFVPQPPSAWCVCVGDMSLRTHSHRMPDDEHDFVSLYLQPVPNDADNATRLALLMKS